MGKATVVAKAARACKQQEQGQNYATINHGQVKPTTGKHDKKSYNMAITKNSQQATTSTRTNGKNDDKAIAIARVVAHATMIIALAVA